MNSKKGEIGSFVVMFVATIIVALLLLGFIYISSMIKVVSDENAGTVIHKEDKIGIEDGVGYMSNYVKLIEVKAEVSKGVSLDDAIGKVGYEK